MSKNHVGQTKGDRQSLTGRKNPRESLNFNGFKGFDAPKYTMVPDEVFDQLLPFLTGAELKILLYICRRTFGFKKDSDNISINQMLRGITTNDGRVLDRGVGVSKTALLKALKSLVAKNIIISVRRSSPEKGNEPTNYRLNFIDEPLGKEKDQGGVQKYTKPLVKKVIPQDTALQETVFKSVNVTSDNVDNSLNTILNNAIKKFPSNDLEDTGSETDFIVMAIMDVCGDRKSKGFYRRVAKLCPRDLIFQALSEAKDLKLTNQIKKTTGAAFNSIIQEKSKRAGIDLGLKKL